jgi:hypothetical protein
MKKGVGSGVGSDPLVRGPDPHQIVTDPQHWIVPSPWCVGCIA